MSRPFDWNDLPKPDSTIADHIVSWYRDHGRSFPWRKTDHPFRLLCTEIMLQRTRAEQVAEVYEEIVSKWQGPGDVLELGEDGVEELFGRLGLIWRARYFWQLQAELQEKWGGEIPDGMDDLLALPGVGPYVAVATRVYAFGARETAVDSNVLRIFGRVYGLDFPDHARRSPRVLRWASTHCPEGEKAPREFNWGLVDLGSLVCTPEEPHYVVCPLRDGCWKADEEEQSTRAGG